MATLDQRREGLREEVRLLRAWAGRNRRFAPAVHVGWPGDVAVELPADVGYDVGMRVDLIAMALDLLEGEQPCVWLTRCGTSEVNDLDLAWCGASVAALASRGWPAAFYVVTRNSWHSPVTDDSRSWLCQRTSPRSQRRAG